MKSRIFCTFALLLTAACTDLPPNANETDADYVEQELDTQGFFQARGYLMSTDTVAGDCVVAANGADLVVPIQAANTGGQEVVFALSLVESSTEIHDRLSLEASASAKFLIAGGDAKFKFAEQTKTSDKTATLLAAVVVRNTSWTVPPGVKLRDDAAALLRGVAGQPATPAQLARFRERCGDGFLHSYTTGGEFYAFIQVQTNSKEEKQAISASMAGNFLTFSGSAAFTNEIKRIVNNSSTLVTTYQIGGEGDQTAACADIACITQRIGTFTSSVATKPVVFGAQVKPYQVLTLPADATTPIDISVTLDAMDLIVQQRNSTGDLLTRFLEVQSNPENYVIGSNTLANVASAITALNANLNALNGALRTCGRAPNSCSMPALSTVSTTVPALKALPAKIMVRAYNGSSEFLKSGTGSCAAITTGAVISRTLDAPGSTFDVVPALNGAVGAVSLRLAGTQKYVLANLSPTACSGTLQLADVAGLTTTPIKEKAVFYRVKGLNGKPNTWSYRLFTTPDPESVGGLYRNRNPTTYLVRMAQGVISIGGQPGSTATAQAIQGFKDNASWYTELP